MAITPAQTIQELVDADGEIVTKFAVIAEVTMPNGSRRLTQCYGSVDGDAPMMWDCLGMIETAAQDIRIQLRECTEPRDE